jgi:hypothetical protein
VHFDVDQRLVKVVAMKRMRMTLSNFEGEDLQDYPIFSF